MTPPVPHYITTPRGQIRVWRTGSGPHLVFLASPIMAASCAAERISALCPDWRVTVVELPGLGGSATVAPNSMDAITAALRDALTWLNGEPYVLVGMGFSCAVATALAKSADHRPAGVIQISPERATQWRSQGIVPGDLSPRPDGAHLLAHWAFLRDCHLLDPANPKLPARSGEPLPDVRTLAETLTAAAVSPAGFTALWRCLSDAASPDTNGVTTHHAALKDELPGLLSGFALPDATAEPPRTEAVPGGAIWHDYVDTASGRQHLRRAGNTGRPLLVIPTGGGSSAQFAPVVSGLAEDRRVFAVDYLGNGLSDKPAGPVSIESCARDMLALIDALGFDEVDVWGSHTGALVALELAVTAPERVGRLVMEGPVFISPDFQQDILDNYFIDLTPDAWGLHLIKVWNWRRDLFMYWPWYRVARENARDIGIPRAKDLHLYAIGILESGTTYDGAYRAAFSYDTRSRLPKLTRPGLVCVGPNDMLKDGLVDAREIGPKDIVTVCETPTTVWWPDPDPKAAAETLALYDRFLRGTG